MTVSAMRRIIGENVCLVLSAAKDVYIRLLEMIVRSALR
jgi:hypothetical protein